MITKQRIPGGRTVKWRPFLLLVFNYKLLNHPEIGNAKVQLRIRKLFKRLNHTGRVSIESLMLTQVVYGTIAE